VQPLKVQNWLQESQRFNVRIVIEPPEAREEIRLHGVETFDLPPGISKEYKFNVYAYRQCTAVAQVVFTNPKTEEYLKQEVEFTFVPPQTLQLIEFKTTCRQVAKHPILVANPLSVPASFKCRCDNDDIRFSPVEFTVAPNAEATVDVLFRPVFPTAQGAPGEAALKLTSAELGDYPYTVRYEVKPASLEKTVVFKARLGSTDTVETFRFLHYAKRPATYTAVVEAAPGQKGAPPNDFVVETKDIRANAATEEGIEVIVDMRFNPSALGETRALLILSSTDGGEYKALLVGYTQPPQPQGPVVIEKSKAGSIEFLNPFEETTEFSVQVDNQCFSVQVRKFRLDAKKSQAINVTFKSDTAQGGRLIVSAPKVSTPWIFFLKGVL